MPTAASPRRRRPLAQPAWNQPRLLEGIASDGSPTPLAVHRQSYPKPAQSGPGGWAQLIDLVDRAGLRGRGGAAFPTGRKLRSVADGARRAVVVANGTEGEPGSRKDTLLLARAPHLVIDGCLWAAAAVGADRVLICIDRSDTPGTAGVRRALQERAATEPTPISIEVVSTPPRYVAGEETALLHFIAGGPAKPTAVPPRPFQRGVDGRPTLVQNVETLAHLTQIAVRGADWFRQAGTPDEPGTALFSVSGAVASPCVVEAPIGTRLADILAVAGAPDRPLQAVLVGGFFGTWVPVAALDAPCSRAGLQAFGAGPGAGVLIALAEGSCGITETSRILAWYSAESAGQCGPCLFGLADLAKGTAALGAGQGGADGVAQLRRWSDQIEGRGGCRHPDGAVRLLRSARAVFAADFESHAHGMPCPPAAGPPALRVPRSATGWK